MDRFVSRIPKTDVVRDTEVEICANDETPNIDQTPNKPNNGASANTADRLIGIQQGGDGKEKKGGRQFRAEWKAQFPWLLQVEDDLHMTKKVICSVCSDGVKAKLLIPTTPNNICTKEAFVTKGFATWNRAVESFRKHEKSEFHLESVRGLSNRKKVTVLQCLSEEKHRNMIQARVALKKIFETILFLAREGLPFRGTYDKDNHIENSKFIHLLELRAGDVPELKAWLNRSSGSGKWTHHDIIEEILKLLADSVLQNILSELKVAKYFSLMLDETADVSRCEQVSLAVRYVTDDLVIREQFVGFYETKETTADVLFRTVKDVLTRFDLNIGDIRGQCYDGAANVSGHVSGLQTRIQEEVPTALFVHCSAHRLNLVVQDALSDITDVRNFIGTVRELINFVRDSPHRLNTFKELQGFKSTLPSLAKYCPTRWCVRVKSLRTVRDNYTCLLKFFEEVGNADSSDAAITSKAFGHLHQLESFSFYLHLIVLISIFERIENLNCSLQATDLHLKESHANVELVQLSIEEQRSELPFDKLWSDITKRAKDLELPEPVLPRIRKAPKRYDSESSPHIFSTPKDYYRKLYYEIIDTTLRGLKQRFKSETMNFLDKVEGFLLKRDAHLNYVEDIITFYKTDNFDAERLILHRDMLLDLMEKEMMPKNLCDIVNFLRKNLELRTVISEVFRLIRIILTIPVTSVTCETSFSALKRIKTYLRSSMGAQRLNNASVLNIHKVDIDLDPLIDEFISRESKRTSTFGLPRNHK